tara:strand:- start:3605 stop:4573 length:969 start_codon:yes stop_codon:yes gene_type:complete
MITAFPVFSNHSTNVSEVVLSEIERNGALNIDAETQLLSVDKQGSNNISERIRNGSRFRGILHLGLAAMSDKIHLERVAKNLISMSEPDNSGRLIESEEIEIGGPVDLETTAPIHILDEEFEHDKLVEWSSDAGGYVCNETFYRTLHALNETGNSDIPTLFVHLPPETSIPIEKQVEKVIQIAESMVSRPIYEVVAALLFDQKGRILACKRPNLDAWAGWWEFPGGKVDEGESAKQALSREIEEELGILVEPTHLVESTSFDYEDRTVNLQIWNCGTIDSDCFSLKEHDESRWLYKEELLDVNWLPADIPIISKWLQEGMPN